MNCSVCGATFDSEVNFCRKCGTSLEHHAPDTAPATTRLMIEEDALFFPQTGAHVVPIEKVDSDDMTLVKQHDYSDLLGAD
ncbi:MAG: hypothetical protein M3R15_31705 [Acidobacteriota bacterium]|nr:hypothetical protein [Acidobacteriota bacterium]